MALVIPNDDAISRKAAIDAIKKLCEMVNDVVEKYVIHYPEYMGAFVTSFNNAIKKDLIDDIRDLQSAQSKTPERTSKTTQNVPNEDLISRKVAIDAILHITNCKSVRELYEYTQEHHLTEYWSGGVVDAVDAVIGVPPIEPEPDMVARHIATILENEQDMRVIQKNADDVACHCNVKENAELIARILDEDVDGKVYQMEQPDATDANVGNMDCISRQAAIDVAKNLIVQMDEYHQYNQAINNYCAELVQLPSAQPETCEGCKHFDKWENEVEYGYSSPCTRCKRRVEDNYER